MHLRENPSIHQILYYPEKGNIELELLEELSNLPRLGKSTKMLKKKKNRTGMVYWKSKQNIHILTLKLRKPVVNIYFEIK